MMLGKALGFAAVLAAGLAIVPAAAQAQAPKKVTIWVKFPGDDPLTTNFRKALLKSIAGDNVLKLVDESKAADIRVVSPAAHIDWDTLDGRIVAIYIVSVENIWGRDFRLSGVCFANDVKKCARDFVRRTKVHAIPPAEKQR